MKELGLEGYVLDTVDDVGSSHIIRKQQQQTGSPFAAVLDGAILLHLMATGESLTRKFGAGGKYFTGELIEDVFWQTMIGGCVETELTQYARNICPYGLSTLSITFYMLLG